MTYDYVILSLFVLATIGSLVQLILALKQQRAEGNVVEIYTIFQIPLFSFLALNKASNLFEWELPEIYSQVYFLVFLILLLFSIRALYYKLKAKAKFKAYRAELFIFVFSLVAVFATYPF